MIKKALFLTSICISSLFSKQYMVQIEPYEKFEVKSEVSGKINFVDSKLENKYIKDSTLLIKINSKDEQLQLQRQKNNLAVQREITKVKEQNFKSKNRVKQISKYEKNVEKLNYIDVLYI